MTEKLNDNLSRLFQLIDRYNLATDINNQKEKKTVNITNKIYAKIKQIPDLNELYTNHLQLATFEHQRLRKYLEKTEDEKIRFNEACSFINDLDHIIKNYYKDRQNELEEIKLKYFKGLYTKIKKELIIKVKAEYAGPANKNIIDFAKKLKTHNHIDSDGEINLIKLLKGGKPDKPIAWLVTKKLRGTIAELSRLIQIMSHLQIFVNPNVSWLDLETNFTVDGKELKDLKNATLLMTTTEKAANFKSEKYKSEEYFEELVKGNFIYPNTKIKKK